MIMCRVYIHLCKKLAQHRLSLPKQSMMTDNNATGNGTSAAYVILSLTDLVRSFTSRALLMEWKRPITSIRLLYELDKIASRTHVQVPAQPSRNPARH